MLHFPTTIILRHRKENLKKCSLRGLENRSDMHFITYPFTTLPDLNNYFALSLEGEPLSDQDANKGVFLIDATWRHAKTIGKQILDFDKMEKRSLPNNLLTAYPRRQEDCVDPTRGLASIEALFATYFILKRENFSLLENYHWKEEFLTKNESIFKGAPHF